MYTKKSSSATTKRWECSKRAALSCNGKVTIDIDVKQVISSVKHNGFAVEATKMWENLRQRAISNRGNNSQILADAIEQLTEDGRVAMGNMNSVERNILRQRKANQPKEPASVQELPIENEWTTTGGQDQLPFLIHDSSFGARNRIIEDGLRRWSSSFSQL